MTVCLMNNEKNTTLANVVSLCGEVEVFDTISLYKEISFVQRTRKGIVGFHLFFKAKNCIIIFTQK